MIEALTSPKPVPFFSLVMLFCELQFLTYFGAVLLAVLLFHRIDADEAGVTWRTLQGKRHATWEDVTDYYEQFPSGTTATLRNMSNRKVRMGRELWIETTHGKFLVGPFLKGDIYALRELVRQSATNSRCCEWGLHGTRTCDTWPRTFQYATPKRQAMAWLTGAGAVIYTVGMAVWLWNQCAAMYSSLEIPEIRTLYGLWWLLAIWPALGLVHRFVYNVRCLLRRGESVTVTPQGFECCLADGTIVSGDWKSVFDYYCIGAASLLGNRYVVALSGSDEKQWSFTSQLVDARLLTILVSQYASPPQTALPNSESWPVKREDGSVTSVDGRIYHYRNRNTRFGLIGGSLFCGAFLLAVALNSILALPARSNDSPAFIIWCFLIFAACLGYAWWRYFVGGIEIDDFWITQRTLFGQRRIAWISITDYKSVGDPYIVRGQKGTPIAFWSTISRFEELKAEIERRAPSPQTGWKKLPAENR